MGDLERADDGLTGFLGVAMAALLTHLLACFCIGIGVVSTCVDDALFHVYDEEARDEGVDGWTSTIFFLVGVGGLVVEVVLFVLEATADFR